MNTKQAAARIKELELQVATLQVELAETTERSANNAKFLDMWKHKYNLLAKQVREGKAVISEPALTGDYATRKAACIALALKTGKPVLMK